MKPNKEQKKIIFEGFLLTVFLILLYVWVEFFSCHNLAVQHVNMIQDVNSSQLIQYTKNSEILAIKRDLSKLEQMQNDMPYLKDLHKSIHKFALQELKYAPFTSADTLDKHIKNIFELKNSYIFISLSSNLPIELTTKNSLKDDQIYFDNSYSVSKINDSTYLTIDMKPKNVPHINIDLKLDNILSTQNIANQKNSKAVLKPNKPLETHLNNNIALLLLGLFSILILSFLRFKTSQKVASLKQNYDLLSDAYNEFVADSAHQLNTPLTSIVMNLELIELSMDTSCIDEQLSHIKAATNGLMMFGSELVYINHHNEQEYKPSLINISQVVCDREAFFKHISIGVQKKIEFILESNINAFVNRVELEHLINNNISNSIKYSNPNSTITITLKKIDKDRALLKFESEGKEIRDTVSIFDKYYRENISDRGHGLGLAISKIICDKYNIKINVERQNQTNSFNYIITI